MPVYSNPRLSAEIADWPLGREVKTRALFTVETKPGKGQRCIRVLDNPRGGQFGPKAGTYSPAVRIVDGDDGRTYVAALTMYGFVSIMRGDMLIQEESIHTDDARYGAVRALFNEGAQ